MSTVYVVFDFKFGIPKPGIKNEEPQTRNPNPRGHTQESKTRNPVPRIQNKESKPEVQPNTEIPNQEASARR